jgi:site-specific recombinase XerD
MKIEEQMRQVMRVRQMSRRTEETYVQWYKRYVIYHRLRHPGEMGEEEVGAFLTYLANDRKVNRVTQNQALNALVFLYRHVLKKELNEISALRASERRRMPIVLPVEAVKRLLAAMSGVEGLQARLLYG